MLEKKDESSLLSEKLKKKKKYLYLDKFESNKTVVDKRLDLMERAISIIHGALILIMITIFIVAYLAYNCR